MVLATAHNMRSSGSDADLLPAFSSNVDRNAFSQIRPQALRDRNCSCCDPLWRVAVAIGSWIRGFFNWLADLWMRKPAEDRLSVQQHTPTETPTSSANSTDRLTEVRPNIQQHTNTQATRFKEESKRFLTEHFDPHSLCGSLLPPTGADGNYLFVSVGCKVGETILHLSGNSILPQNLSTFRDQAIQAIFTALDTTSLPLSNLLQLTTYVEFTSNHESRYRVKVSTHQIGKANTTKLSNGIGGALALKNFLSPYGLIVE